MSRRHWLWAIALFVLLVVMIAANTYFAISGSLRAADLTTGDDLMQLVKRPALMWLALCILIGTQAWISRAEAAEQSEQATATARVFQSAEQAEQQDAAFRRSLSLQLVGAQLITPYISRGLPLQAQLPTVLNNNPLKKPKAFYMPASGGTKKFKYMLKAYLGKVLTPFETPFWVQRPKNGYPGTSFFYNGLKWTRHQGKGDGSTIPETDNDIPLFVTLPSAVQPTQEPQMLDPDGRLVKPVTLPPKGDDYSKQYDEMLASFSPLETINFHLANDLYAFIGNKKLGHHPIHYRFGGASVGFTSLIAAFDYLETHPSEVVWLLSIDAPGYGPDGKDEQPNEAAVLLMLAHRDFDTGREPLALIHRPVRATEEQGKTPLARLKYALKEAVERGDVQPADIGRYFHDATGGQALGLAAQAATETLPGFEWNKQQYSLPAWLGEMGASTTAYHLLLAAWAAHTEGKPMLVADVTETQDAVLVVPPKDYTPVDTKQPYWAARSENDYSRPWWGKRKDGKPDVGMSPMFKDDDTPAKPAPPYTLKYD
jgi:type II secretory pathway pseudopilin PulG